MDPRLVTKTDVDVRHYRRARFGASRAWSGAGELRVALLAERGHALDEVARSRRERLVRAFELEQRREVGLEARVEQALREARARVGPAASRVASSSASAPELLRVFDAAVGEAERHRFLAGRALAEHDHRLRLREPDEPREQVGATGVDDEPPLVERPEEPRVVGWTSTKSHASARCAPGPTAAPLTAATVGLSISQSSRMNAWTPTRSASAVVRGSNPGRPACETVDAERSIPAQNASPVEVMQERRAPPGRPGRPGSASVMQVAHLDGERVLRLGAIEGDDAHPGAGGLDVDGHDVMLRPGW